MPFSRRRFQSGKRPIVSNKEIVDGTFLSVAAGVTTDFVIASQVNNYTGTVGDCPLGTTILGFYIESSAANIGANVAGRVDWFLGKVQGSPVIATYFPVPGATGGDDNRRMIFHESKGLLNAAGTTGEGGTPPRSREFISIPKKFRRMGENDRWVIRIGSSEGYSACFKVIYKWYQ